MRHRTHRPHGPAFLGRALAFEEVGEHRHLGCGLYTLCLQVVVRRQWPGFSCQPCSLWPGRCAQPSGQTGPAQVLPMPAQGRR